MMRYFLASPFAERYSETSIQQFNTLLKIFTDMKPLAGTTFLMNVKHLAQGASGASYVVNFQAEIIITVQTTIEIAIASVNYPNDPDPSDVAVAQQAIHQGCAEVLAPINCGAAVVIINLVIHPVDFKPKQHAHWMAIDLQQHLDELSGASA